MTSTLEHGITQRVQVHFDDLDAMGIVHNAKYAVLVERAITAFWLAQGWTFDRATTRFPDDLMLAVREYSVTFHAPISAVPEVAVRLWIEHFGRTSVTYHFRVISADGSVLHAEGVRAQVKLDPVTRRPAEITPELRKAAAQLLAQQVA